MERRPRPPPTPAEETAAPTAEESRHPYEAGLMLLYVIVLVVLVLSLVRVYAMRCWRSVCTWIGSNHGTGSVDSSGKKMQ